MSEESVMEPGRRRRLIILLPRFAIVVGTVLLLVYLLSYAADTLQAYAFTGILWHTSQKRAQLALLRCIAHQNLNDYADFEKQAAIMLGASEAGRAARPPRNADGIREGLRKAGVSSQDADKIVHFSGVLSWFNSSIIRKNQEDTERAGLRVQRQLDIGAEIKRELESKTPNRARLDQLQRDLDEVDAEGDIAAQEFLQRTRSLIQQVTRILFLTIALGTLLLLYLSFAELRGMLARLLKTERNLRRREEQLFEARKLDALGRLAASVAHDFNNLLMVISGAVEMILWQLPSASRQRKLAEGILEATRQGSTLTRQLLVFSHRQVTALQPIQLDRQVEESKHFVEHLIGPGIELNCILKAGHALFRMDRAQFTQILLNLAANARDAMPNGGTLTIRTALASPDEVPLHSQSPDGYVLLEVSDDGIGMAEETKMRIFEPFFTTKAAGQGTGLGLSTVYGIVTQSNGVIAVESQIHRGTTFRLFFPCSCEVPVPAETPPAARPQPTTGGETILLVEDQDALREVSRSALELDGYHVIAAKNCEDAIELAKVYSGEIHLLLTDVVLPKLSGREVSRQLHVLRPEVKVIYMSGYAPSDVFDEGALEPGAGFLQKPCSILDISRKIREVLDGAPENQRASPEGTVQ